MEFKNISIYGDAVEFDTNNTRFRFRKEGADRWEWTVYRSSVFENTASHHWHKDESTIKCPSDQPGCLYEEWRAQYAR